MTPRMIIQICPNEPSVSPCLMDGRECSEDSEVAKALADCTGSGDAEDACRYVCDRIGVEWRIVAREGDGYVNRLATDEEKTATAQAIYFESETDFTDTDMAEVYLVWEAANNGEF